MKPNKIIKRGINIANGGIIITKRAYTTMKGVKYLKVISNNLVERFPMKRTTR